MNLDLHVHTVFSIDSPVTPEQYAEKMLELQKNYEVHGLVFMEHKLYKSDYDYEALAAKTGLVILSGIEADTMFGHLLCYGMTDDIFTRFDLRNRCRDAPALISAIAESGGVAVPAHPFRSFMSMGLWLPQLKNVNVLEGLNAGSSEQENESALAAAKSLGWATVGGSDAHFLGELGACLTEFPDPVRTMPELCQELKRGRCRAINLADAAR